MSRADAFRQVFPAWIRGSQTLREGQTPGELRQRDLQAFCRQGAMRHAHSRSRGVGEESCTQLELAARVASRISRVKVVRVNQVSARKVKALPRRPP